MRFLASIVLAIVAVLSVASAVSVYDGMAFTKPVKSTPNGKLFLTETRATGASPDIEHVRFHVAHVYGSPRERGYAYGNLLRTEITKMMTVDVPLFLIMGDAGKQIANEYLPKEIQERLNTAKGFDIWSAVLEALLWVYEQQEPYLQLDPTSPIAAMDGLADALCDGEKACDDARRATLRNLVHALNMFPELVRMGCSTVGSWGSANNATMPGLIQLRALDFGEGPWANNHVLLVEHPDKGNAFASLSFYGLLGIITSVSERLAQTEKLFKDGTGFQTGTYDGSTLTFVIRRIMETANSKEEALQQIEETKRTWAVFLGFGDRAPKPEVDPMFVVAYKAESAQYYTDKTIADVTHAVTIPDVIYIDRHPQPSSDTRMQTLLLEQQKQGGITTDFILQNIPQGTGTGDVHMQLYDSNTEEVFYSIGLTNNYQYVENGKAMYRPWVRFNVTDLLSHAL